MINLPNNSNIGDTIDAYFVDIIAHREEPAYGCIVPVFLICMADGWDIFRKSDKTQIKPFHVKPIELLFDREDLANKYLSEKIKDHNDCNIEWARDILRAHGVNT